MSGRRRRDQRSPEAETWHRLYSLAIWRRPKTGLGAGQLAKQPLCERHLKRGLVVPADTVHHKVPHKGDRALFADRSVEPLPVRDDEGRRGDPRA